MRRIASNSKRHPRTERGIGRFSYIMNLPTALQTAHTARFPSRYNEGNNRFEILYLAEDHTVALYEVQAMLGSPLHGVTLPNPFQAWAVLNVDVVLDHVVDLTDVNEQAVIDTNAQELIGDWRGYQLRGPLTSVQHPTGIPAPTQKLGAALYGQGAIEGFRTVSARVPTRKILGVFPRRLSGRSQIVFKDHTGTVLHRIP